MPTSVVIAKGKGYVEGVCLDCLNLDHTLFDSEILWSNITCKCGGHIKCFCGFNTEEGKAKVRNKINRVLNDPEFLALLRKDWQEWLGICNKPKGV